MQCDNNCLGLYYCLCFNQGVDRCLASSSLSVWPSVQGFYLDQYFSSQINIRSQRLLACYSAGQVSLPLFYPEFPLRMSAFCFGSVTSRLLISILFFRSPSLSPSFAAKNSCTVSANVSKRPFFSTALCVLPSLLALKACQLAFRQVSWPPHHRVGRELSRSLRVPSPEPAFSSIISIFSSSTSFVFESVSSCA